MSESSIIKDFKKLIGADNVLDSEADTRSSSQMAQNRTA